MNADLREKILAMARHEFSSYSRLELNEEHKRKLLLKEFYMFGHTLTKGELLALFETLISEVADAQGTSKGSVV